MVIFQAGGAIKNIGGVCVGRSVCMWEGRHKAENIAEFDPMTFLYTFNMWKILKEMGIPDHLTCLLRNLYTGQEAIVRTEHETMDWFQTGKGVH